MSRLSPEAFFRCLLIVTLLAGAASGLIAIFPGDITEDWRTITEWNGNGGYYDYIEDIISPTGVLGRVAWIASLVALLLFLLGVYVGLFLFWRFARLANLLLTIAFVLVTPWAGMAVFLPLEATLYDFTMLCEGALVALSYTSPIKEHFERKKLA